MSNRPEDPIYGPMLERLRERYREAQRNRAKNERDDAPRYNVLSLLGIDRYEAWLHSPFLRNLLDPYGSHGQGAVFLREFVSVIASRLKWTVPAIDDWPSPGDWVVRNEVEKIDLSLQSTAHGWLLFVENKIHAGFQPSQMQRYREMLDSYNGFKNRALILLVPRAYRKSDPQTGYAHVVLHYEDDIAPLLTRALQQVKPEHVRGTVHQYIAVILTWGESDMASDTNDLGHLLMDPENLALALDVVKVLEGVKKTIERNFWMRVEHDLQDALNELGLTDDWILVSTPNRENPAQRFLIPTRDAGATGNVAVGVFHESETNKLTYGVCFLAKRNSPRPVELDELRSALVAKFGQAPDYADWWLYYRESAIKPWSRDFLVQASADAQGLARQFTSLLREILEEYDDALLAADLALG